MDIARIIISIVMAVLLLFTGGGKVLRLKFSQVGREQLKLPQWFWVLTGSLELAAVVGLVWGIWYVPFGLVAAIGVAVLMIGAVLFRFRSGDAGARRGSLADIPLFLGAVALIVLNALSL
jgi:hypothetical protein